MSAEDVLQLVYAHTIEQRASPNSAVRSACCLQASCKRIHQDIGSRVDAEIRLAVAWDILIDRRPYAQTVRRRWNRSSKPTDLSSCLGRTHLEVLATTNRKLHNVCNKLLSCCGCAQHRARRRLSCGHTTCECQDSSCSCPCSRSSSWMADGLFQCARCERISSVDDAEQYRSLTLGSDVRTLSDVDTLSLSTRHLFLEHSFPLPDYEQMPAGEKREDAWMLTALVEDWPRKPPLLLEWQAKLRELEEGRSAEFKDLRRGQRKVIHFMAVSCGRSCRAARVLRVQRPLSKSPYSEQGEGSAWKGNKLKKSRWQQKKDKKNKGVHTLETRRAADFLARSS
eukprot:TRINITY_DN8239_c0_g1_i3.p1 TRINITY_DN8239_c0_g1~~TRINITY_DN8239_c0_g1_i3.p1  ORF type:complete len:339 (+),score=15.24 TRINITY_DN8239_c0_g1_i3:51-1067(+)